MLITCEHASNEVKYTKLQPEEEELFRTHEYYDVGAADFSYSLAEELKCIAVMANFTKLFVDPAKPLLDSQLIRLTYKQRSEDNKEMPVSLNS